ncbi:type IV pilus assembly protein PilV [Halopseudomonas sabulinigri]|uniref:Type IV pilus assembly protein PilV n=1 Tax=Halopseudomonas sabulinigri TaxID=472181 RepID=A0A1H1WC84_9GAMM|nr:type IV pilus modification protein PilV [Halopseudomonas sabulinigri]SDS94280.1 type IV pilus assembly protein PilV [Halopseudomonas sabulinigri]
MPFFISPPLAAARGFSLLEVLVAVLVLALGILGAASLQLSALRYHSGSLHATHASLLAQDMLERLRANPEQIAFYAMTVDADCEQAAAHQLTVSADSVLAQDKLDFTRAVTCELPAGRARLSLHNGMASLHLQWSEARQFVGAADAELRVTALLGAQP